MRERKPKTIDLFVASGAETKEIRSQIVVELQQLSRLHQNSGVDFQVQWWEAESAAVPMSRRSQDEYNKLIDRSDMVAVIIKNTVGKYTEEEFDYAIKRSGEPGVDLKVVVYTLSTNDDDESRTNLIKRLRTGGLDYFHVRVKNEEDLYGNIKGELLFIKDKFVDSVEGVEETRSRLDFDNDLTREAIEKFEKGEYSEAIAALDMDKIRERVRKASTTLNDAANAMVLRAKLELTDIKNSARFKNAEEFFDEALNVSRTPRILFEYAYYCDNQNIYDKAITLYTEALELYRELAASNRAAYIPNVAMTLNNLSILHSDINEYGQAEAGYREALELYRELAASNRVAYIPDVAMTLNNLANLHSIINDHGQAKARYREALELYRELAASNRAAYIPDVAMTLNNLASLHNTINKYGQAEAEYREALELYRELAASHRVVYIGDVARTLNNLANLHRTIDENEQAEAEYREALELHRELAASNHSAYIPNVAGTLNNLASLHSIINDYGQAEAEYREALELLTPYYNANPHVHQKLYNEINQGLQKLTER